jgi:hypothetical protein
MKYYKFLLIIFLVIAFACTEKTQSDNSSDNAEVQVVESVVLVDQILSDPDTYVGKVVEVEGLVTHVCKHSGKRLHLTSTASSEMIRVEATGDIRQFKRELEGSDIRVKGKVQKLVIDEDYLSKWENEMTSKGENHDHNSHEEETEQLNNMRKRLENSGKEQLVSYWVDGISFEVN